MPYIKGMKVKLRDGAVNRYRMTYGHGVVDGVWTVVHTDTVQRRQRIYLDGLVPMAWVGDLKLASDKKGLGK